MTLLYHQIRQQMEEQVAQKSSELEQYLQRVRELEDMYLKLQEALEDERQARQDEETVRKLQARCQISLYTVSLCTFLGMTDILVKRGVSLLDWRGPRGWAGRVVYSVYGTGRPLLLGRSTGLLSVLERSSGSVGENVHV